MKKIKLLGFAYLLFGIGITQGKSNTTNEDVQQKLDNVDKQFFIENKGQWPHEVLYLTQMGGLNTWITTKGMLYEFYKTEKIKDESSSIDKKGKFDHPEYKLYGHRVGYKLIGNNNDVNVQGRFKQNGYYNYLIGNDPGKHASNVGLYKEAVVKSVYTGIDMRYYFDNGLLRYDYIIEPGADPSQIKFAIEGSEKSYVNDKGELVFTTCFGEVKNADLYCYQEDKKQVKAKFINQGKNWTIELGNYDKQQPLIIDPLIYSTYIGGSSSDMCMSGALDASGNVYTAGYTQSTNYVVTTGAFQETHEGYQDVIVSKLNASGTAIIYSTLIGGSSYDAGYSIALDASNNAYITGATSSSNFDVTSGAYHTSYAGGYDVFVCKLNTTGTTLLYSTLIGGDRYDGGYSIAVDASNNAYVTGFTEGHYNITTGAFQTTYAGIHEVFVTKLNASGSALVYSTYIGGNGDDKGNSIILDASGNAYITGGTSSSNFDYTTGAFQTVNAGSTDIFVSELNATGTNLLYSTLIGGSANEYGASIALDASGNACISGQTSSSNFDITSGAFQTTYAGSNDAFVSKISPNGNGGSDLLYSTYLGGSGNDIGCFVSLDASGLAYVAGSTFSTNYHFTSGAFQTFNAGMSDVFVTKLCLNPPTLTPSITGDSEFCEGDDLTFTGSVTVGDADNHFWEIAECDAFGNIISGGLLWNNWYSGAPTGSFTFPGSLSVECGKYYKIKLALSNTCNSWSETNKVVYINCNPTITTLNDVTLCAGDDFPVSLNAGGKRGYTYSWTYNGNPISGVNFVGTFSGPNASVNVEGEFCAIKTQTSTGCQSDEVCVTVEYDDRLDYSPQYSLQQYNCNESNPTFNVEATFPLAPSGLSYAWYIYEVDDASGSNPNLVANNPSSWWTGGTSQDFDPEFTFYKEQYYKIKRAVWSSDGCVPWTEYSIIFECTVSGSRIVFSGFTHNNENKLESKVDKPNNMEFTLQPNPTMGNVTVNLSKNTGNELIELIDYTGKVVLSEKMNAATKTIDLNHLSNGIYFVKVIAGNEVKVEKLIKQ